MNKDPKKIKRDEAKLDMLNGIDEEIIDRNTEKRISMMQAVRRKTQRRILIPILAGAASFFFLFSVVMLLFRGGDDPTVEKQIPIYQGMTVSTVYEGTPSVRADEAEGLVALCRQAAFPDPLDAIRAGSFTLEKDNGNNGNNGNHYGQHKGEESESETLFETESETLPEIESESETLLETETESTLTDFESASELYYAHPNQEIFITIHFSNPDNFEIMSFTLNGKKFSSYMFEEGSDMEHLILRQRVGSVEGIEEFTIDAIKYIDGTEIKDVRMDGDRTVRVGVYEKETPDVSVSEPLSGFCEISAAFSANEMVSLLGLSKGQLRAVLYEGEVKLSEQLISLDALYEGITVTFGGLTTKTEYKMTLEATLLDGEARTVTVWEKEVTTRHALSVENLVAGKEDLSFALAFAEDYTQKEILSVAILDGETEVVRYDAEALIRDLQAGKLSFGGLLSDHTYTLTVAYRDGEGSSKLDVAFTTPAKEVPTFSAESVTADQTSVSFTVAETDTDNVGAITKIELLQGENEPVVAESTDLRKFEGLLSNNEYAVRVTYTYDLNDGVGAQTIVVTKTVKTKAKTEPTLEIDSITSDQTSVSFTVAESDADNIGAITKIELLHGDDEPIPAENIEQRKFEGLLSNNKYAVRVTYTYDLNDGQGMQTGAATRTVKTVVKKKPSYHIQTTSDQTSIDFTLTETDMDNVGAITKIELLHGDDEPIVAQSLDLRKFEGLLSNNKYAVQVTYVYDLNDGQGMRTDTVARAIKTVAKTKPTYQIEATSGPTSIDFTVTENDPDGLGTVTKIELLRNGNVIQTAADASVRRFEGLSQGCVYTVKVTCTYDLNAGLGVETEIKESTVAYRYVSVTQLSTDEDTILLIGETLPLKVTVNRPEGVTLEMKSAKVNGVEYSLRRLTANTYEIIYTPTTESGREELRITELSYTVDGQPVIDFATQEPSLAIAIRGDVTVEQAVLSQEGVYFIGDTMTATVTLRGTEGYDEILALLDEEGQEYLLTQVMGDTYRMEIPYKGPLGGTYCGVFECTFPTIKVIVDGDDTEVYVHSETISYVIMDPQLQTVTEIRTPEELQNMENGRAYRLADHVDLAGFDWIPYAFNGVLYGNGYEIRNLDMFSVIPYNGREEDRFPMGMFTELNGYFKDVILKNAYVELESEHCLGGSYTNGYYGILAGSSDNLLLDGCTVEGKLYIHTPGDITRSTISGIIGYDGEYGGMVLKNCHFKGNISVEGVLGFTGTGYYSTWIHPLHGSTVIDCSYEFEANVNEYRSTGDFLAIYEVVGTDEGSGLVMSTKKGEKIVIIRDSWYH
ncbi:MAG: hypothetical protein IKA76_08745 [Clostridia bacterium]|nr:hypothetical protein [Clostridia bacterium]